jgi:hypothetical protein
VLERELETVPFAKVVTLVDETMEDCCGGGGVTVELSISDLLLSERVVLGVLGSAVLTFELLFPSEVETGGVEDCAVEDDTAEDDTSADDGAADDGAADDEEIDGDAEDGFEVSGVSRMLLCGVAVDEGATRVLEACVLLGIVIPLVDGSEASLLGSGVALDVGVLLKREDVDGVTDGVIVGGRAGVSVTSTVDPGRTTDSAVGKRRVTVVSTAVRDETMVVLPNVAVLPSVVPPTIGSQARSPIR